MNKTKAAFAILLILTLCISTHAESSLVPFIDAAEKLAFETDNVTITGKAEFLLDGKRFKTAEISYVQDGENSFWQEKLLTPEDWRPDRESGFTVVQYVDEIIGDEIFVTETLHPGLYRHGYSNAEKTLIRRSPITDLLLAMSRSAAVQLEPFFGSAVTLEEREDGSRELKLELQEEHSPELLSFLANLGMRWIGERLFGINGDIGTVPLPALQVQMPPETETQRILCETRDLTFLGASARIGLDASGRLASASGDLSVRLNYYTEEDRRLPDNEEGSVQIDEGIWQWFEKREQVLTVRFDITGSRYGESRVASFDPTGLKAVSRKDMFLDELHWQNESKALTAQEEARLEQRGRELCRAAGIEAGERTDIYLNDGWVSLCFEAENGPCRQTMTEDGLLLELVLEEGGFDGNYGEESCPDDLKQQILSFLHQANPELNVQDLQVIEKLDDGENSFVYVIGTTVNRDDILLSIRLTPSWRIEEYTCLGHG